MTNNPFTRVDTGNYEVRLSARERSMLRNLPSELTKQLEAGDDDGSIYRLFPPGYTDDLGRQVEYDRLMSDDLQSHHLQVLRLLQDTADAELLNEDQMHTWLKAINQLRLVLGTRLDVAEDADFSGIDTNDPKAQAFMLYVYLGELQHQAIAAIDPALDDTE